jgi:hypothetical protein
LHLSKTISFRVSHIAQNKTDAAVNNNVFISFSTQFGPRLEQVSNTSGRYNNKKNMNRAPQELGVVTIKKDVELFLGDDRDNKTCLHANFS